MGVTKLNQLNPEMLCIKNLSDHISVVPKDYLAARIYDRMMPPAFKDSKL
jgi:hypothetical protein